MAADAMSLAEDSMRLATKFFKKAKVAWGADFSLLMQEVSKIDNDTLTRFATMMGEDPNIPQSGRRFLQDEEPSMTPTWPAAIPEGTGLDPWVREVINNITQGTGPTEDLDFEVARAKYRVKVKATLKAKFLALQVTKLAAFKA